MFFKLSEFECKCGCGSNVTSSLLITKLDSARVWLVQKGNSIPFIITSGTRCKEHNAKEGGEKDSSHITGWAVDIQCLSKDNKNRWLIIESLYQQGINRIGIAKTFIHVDIDPNKAREVIWLY